MSGGSPVDLESAETFSWDEVRTRRVVILNMAYLEQHVPLVRDRLKRAGIRLENLLNTTLGQWGKGARKREGTLGMPRIFSLRMGPLFDPGFDERVG